MNPASIPAIPPAQDVPAQPLPAPLAVLLVEDDPDIAELLEYAFAANGFAPEHCASGEKALAALQARPYPLVILDIMLPGISGVDVLKAIRKDAALADCAVIMLTARGEEIDRVVGLELGADDYVVKPFSTRELLLRAKGLLARLSRPAGGAGRPGAQTGHTGQAEWPGQAGQTEWAGHTGHTGHTGPAGPASPEESFLQGGGLRLDISAHRAFNGEEELQLTATEFRLLAELLRHKGRVLSRERLLESVWDYSFEGYARTVDTHIRRLRQKIGQAAEYIETLRSVGYRFKA